MKVFVGFGYNDRDRWIEEQVLPILEGLGFTVVSGKDMHGVELQPEVRSRIEQSDAAIGFFTIREGQAEADYTSHIWVRDEMMYAAARDKPIIPIQEDGARVPRGLLGDRAYILLRQDDRLACVKELIGALQRRNMRHLKLDPHDEQLRRNLFQWMRSSNFVIQYRSRDESGLDSPWREGRLELVDQGFYLNVSDVPTKAYIEVEGILNGNSAFASGWVSANAVQVPIF